MSHKQPDHAIKKPKGISIDTNMFINCLRDDKEGIGVRKELNMACTKSKLHNYNLIMHKAILEELLFTQTLIKSATRIVKSAAAKSPNHRSHEEQALIDNYPYPILIPTPGLGYDKPITKSLKEWIGEPSSTTAP